MSLRKRQPIRSKKVRDAAKGELCAFQIPGVCSHDPETTVLCHLPDESHGMGRKSDDASAAFGCASCHNWVDRRAKNGEGLPDGAREWYMRRAQTRTLRRLIELGILKIA